MLDTGCLMPDKTLLTGIRYLESGISDSEILLILYIPACPP